MSNDYFEKTALQYQGLRDVLHASLEKVGFKPIKAHGGYFLIADLSHLDSKGQDLSKYLTEHAGVTPIPVGAFYQKEDAPTVKHLVRFAFCKEESIIKQGAQRLEKYFLE